MVRKLAAIIGIVGLGAAAPAGPALDELIRFEAPSSCEPANVFRALMSSVLVFTPAGDSYSGALVQPRVPPRFRRHVGQAQLAITGDAYRVTIPLRGTWRGLKLDSLEVVEVVESEGGFELLFDASVHEVLSAANSAGFAIPASGEVYRDDDVMGVNIAVSRRKDLTSLSCYFG